MSRQQQLGDRLVTVKLARRFARESEATAYMRIREGFGARSINPLHREAHAECNEALRIIQREVDVVRGAFLDTFYQ